MKKTIDNLGRIVIPKSYRKELGIEPGEEVNLDLKGKEIKISKIGNGNLVEEKLKQRIRELERQITIKDSWCNMIWAIGCDYDGYDDSENLKGVIDELVDYSQKAMNNDDTSPVYSHSDENKKEIKSNILFEEISQNEPK